MVKGKDKVADEDLLLHFPMGMYSSWYTWSMFYPHVIRLLEEDEQIKQYYDASSSNNDINSTTADGTISNDARVDPSYSFFQMGMKLLENLLYTIPPTFHRIEVSTAPETALWFQTLYNKDIFGPLGPFHTTQLLFNCIISIAQNQQQQQSTMQSTNAYSTAKLIQIIQNLMSRYSIKYQ
eukprot:1437316-Ditylum_brightwellii.AAC.1